MIGDAIWYTGAVNSTKNMTTIQSYVLERGNAVVCTNCNDGVTRKTKWLGKVGLIYPSDYGYSKKNKSCYSISLYASGYDNGACKNDTWMSASWDFTISPYANEYSVAIIASWNSQDSDWTSGANKTYPTLYLKSDVKITSGIGTSSNPFQLELGDS